MGYAAILFDMDGTLMETLEDIADSLNAILRQLGCPERRMDEVRAFVGNGAEMLVRRAMPEGSGEEEITRALTLYQAHYAAHCREKTQPYEGIVPLLEALKRAGRSVAVVSNKPEGALRTLCDEYFEGLVQVVSGDLPGRRRKPWPDMADAALAALGAERKDAVYVGDSEVDVQTGRNAELPVIAVSWGFRGREKLEAAGAETIVDTPEELLERLL
jgi:phosphoglycolate phosphatase